MEIIATFKNGRSVIYTTAILNLLKTDPDIIRITTKSGEIIYQK